MWSTRYVRESQTLFIDDIDGSVAEGTVRFALYGTPAQTSPAGSSRCPEVVLPPPFVHISVPSQADHHRVAGSRR
jgi:hypothetical protein